MKSKFSYLVVYSALVITFGITIMWDSEVVTYLTGLLALLSIIISFPKAQRLYKFTATIFLSIALVIIVLEGISVVSLPYFATSTVILIMIFYVLPFINSVIVVGRYDRKVNQLLKVNSTHLGQLHQRTAIVSYLLGSFLNIGTLPLVVSVLDRNLKEQALHLKNRFISTAMLRGYALCLVWSPMEILVAITVDITGTSYASLLPFLLLFSFMLMITTLLLSRSYRQYQMDSESQQVDMAAVFKKIASLLFFLILFITTIIVLQNLFRLSFLETVGLVIIPYSFFWALVIKRIRSFLVYGFRAWKARTSSLQNYIVLFLSVGFFISVLSESRFMEFFQYPFLLLEDMPILLFMVIQVLFLGLAMMGFHPLVTMSLVGEMIQPILHSVSPMALAMVLITSGLSTVMAGPFNISVSLTGMLIHQNPYRVSMWNIGFAFFFSTGGTIMAMILHYT